ncbi:MAG: hypothetical protein WC249_01885 [Patescibacteria group bacterium]|jgi:chromosome segregation ATPase
MANSSLDKFNSFLQDEKTKESEQQNLDKQSKEEARQAKMAALKNELPVLTTELTGSQSKHKETNSNLNESLEQRKQVKADGRNTLAKAKELGKVELLRSKSQEFFGENIAKLKNIKESVNKDRDSLRENQEKLRELKTEVKQKQEELTRLENEPVTERIQELENKFLALSSEYKELGLSLEKKRAERDLIGISEGYDGAPRFARGDGYGPSPEFIDNYKNLSAKEKIKSEQERSPIKKVLDIFVGSLSSDRQQQLRDNRNSYDVLQGLLLSEISNKTDEERLINQISSNNNLSRETVAAVRDLVARYEKMGKEGEEIKVGQDKLWDEMNKMQAEKAQKSRGLGASLEEHFNSLKDNLSGHKRSLEMRLQAIKYYEDNLKKIDQEKTELNLSAQKQTDDFKRSLEEVAKFNFNINENSLASYKPTLDILSAYLEKIRDNIKKKGSDIRELENKKIIINKKGKIEEINQEIISEREQEKEVVSFWKSFSEASLKFQEIKKEIDKKNKEYIGTGDQMNSNNEEIVNLTQSIKDLEKKINEEKEKVIEVKAWSQAKFEKIKD